jgi:hypothetical protein
MAAAAATQAEGTEARSSLSIEAIVKMPPLASGYGEQSCRIIRVIPFPQQSRRF